MAVIQIQDLPTTATQPAIDDYAAIAGDTNDTRKILANVLSAGTTNVDVYGAVGDGVTDDTTAITNAITAAGANGVVLFKPGKTYLTTSQITISANGITLFGYGATITSATQNQYQKFLVSAKTDCRFLGLKFSLLQTNGAGLLGAGAIEVTGASSDIVIADCEFNETRANGVYVVGAPARVTIRDNQFYRNFCAIFFDDNGVTQPSNCVISGNVIRTGLGAVGTAFSGAIKISGYGDANSYAGHSITGNVIASPGQMGIELQTYVNGCTISNNTVTGSGYGISLSVVTRCTVSGNAVKAFTSYGIELAGALNCTATGNSCDGTDTAGAATSTRGIQSSDNAAYCTVVGNVLRKCDIYLFTSSHMGVVGNSFYGGTVYIHATDKTNVTGNNLTADGDNVAITIDISGSSTAYKGIAIIGNSISGTYAFSLVRVLSTSGSATLTSLLVANNNTSSATSGSAAYEQVLSGSTSTVNMVQTRDNLGDQNAGSQYDWLNFPILTVTGSFTLDERLDVVLADATSGALSETLPGAAANYGRTLTVKKIDAGGNAVTVVGTIDGAVNYALAAQNKYVTVRSNGTAWYVIANN